MIKKLLKKAKKNKQIIKSGAYLLLGTSALNLLNYLFHIYLGRTLGPAEYGVFFSLLSLLYIVGIISPTIQTSLTNFIAKFSATKNIGKIKFLLVEAFKKLSLYGIITIVIFLLLHKFIAEFLKIEQTSLFFILALIIIGTFLLPISRGGLQGLQKFKGLGLNYTFEGIIKLSVAILLISIGLKVAGALWALFLSVFIPIFLAYPYLKKVLKVKAVKIETKEVYRYSMPVFFAMIGTNLLFNVDILLVKHFFPPIEAGQYAALSLLGKIIFFGCIAVSLMMFPKISELYAKKKFYKEPLYTSMKLVLLFGGLVTLIYFIFPEIVINLLFGSQYLGIKNVLGLFGVFMTMVSLAYLIFLYNLSTKQVHFIPFLYAANLLEILLIYIFHETFLQVVLSLIATIFILLVLLFIVKEKNNENLVFNPNV